MRLQGALGLKSQSALLGKALSVSAFVVLLCFSAYIKIPLFFTPVPMTLQNFIVFLAGAMLGAEMGTLAVGAYLLLGLFGVPLFANAGAGMFYLFGPTGGYIFGFIISVWLIGTLKSVFRAKGFLSLYAAILCGMFAIYACGGLWLAVGFGWGLKQILFFGVAPFILLDIVKAACAAAIAGRFK